MDFILRQFRALLAYWNEYERLRGIGAVLEKRGIEPRTEEEQIAATAHDASVY